MSNVAELYCSIVQPINVVVKDVSFVQLQVFGVFARRGNVSISIRTFNIVISIIIISLIDSGE